MDECGCVWVGEGWSGVARPGLDLGETLSKPWLALPDRSPADSGGDQGRARQTIVTHFSKYYIYIHICIYVHIYIYTHIVIYTYHIIYMLYH